MLEVIAKRPCNLSECSDFDIVTMSVEKSENYFIDKDGESERSCIYKGDKILISFHRDQSPKVGDRFAVQDFFSEYSSKDYVLIPLMYL